jgi:glycosyltransferase involved in cell wall biosynthesis
MAAFACRPGGGSEPGAGWALASGAARAGHDVTLVTQPRNRALITTAISADPALSGLHPHFVGLPAGVMELWDRVLGLRGLQLYYLAWQLPLLAKARQLHSAQPFDIAHHATMTNDWIPSGLARAGIPAFVWGPLGGSERVPPACRGYLGPRGRTMEWVRTLTAGGLRACVGRAGRQRISLLVAQNDDEARHLRRRGRPVAVSPNVFLDPSWFPEEREVKACAVPGHRFTAVSIGRLVAWKGIHLALQAMRHEELADWDLHIYGRGPERRRVASEVRRWGLSDRVFLHEPVSRPDIKKVMQAADALLYPSMRDAASWVVGEALAVGCPVVCLDVGGPPLLVRTCGTTVPTGGDLPGNLARALANTAHADRRVTRWGDDRIPGLLLEWYGGAQREEGIGRHSRADPRSSLTSGAKRAQPARRVLSRGAQAVSEMMHHRQRGDRCLPSIRPA